ncbi:Clp protease N-terminal domain-containing protein [Polymorphospora sp. NPDC050346]|uniref:Clp protease N-terminal domain-containing protein n=1 Tax=Polymorphospora sp. NPDC050346 TaxID=3155780 RepID=UPI0033EFAAD2
MPKINVYLPDELAEAVREAGVPVSAVCQRALEQAVRRVTAIRETSLGDVDGDDLAARLPHFTARARDALRLGIDRARIDGSPIVGSGHLLHGLLTEGANLALQVLPAVEIEPARIARDLARETLAESDPVTPAGSRRFSVPAAGALELAVTEATAYGHNYVGCEHLLLGLIAEPDGVAGKVLRSLGAELRLTRRAVAAALAGYVHLRAQTTQPVQDGGPPALPTQQGGPAAGPEMAAALGAAIRRELQPLVERIERLEERAGPTG